VTKVVFETSTLADVLKKASLVAPSRGEAFDKAAGVLITVARDIDQIMVQATNLEIFYTEWISPVSVTLPDGVDEVKWRLPSRSTAAIVGSFPIGSGKEVWLEQPAGTNTLKIGSGRARGSFQLIDTKYYPVWDIFDPDDLTDVEDFGARLAQVEWACSDEVETSFNGVNLTGDYAQATDRYRAARVPLKVDADTAWPFAESVTVPSRILSQIMKQSGQAAIGCTPTQLLVLPNEHVQIRANLFGQEYMSLAKITGQEYTHTVPVNKAGLLEVLNRVQLMAGSDRLPSMRMFIGKGEIAAMMEDVEEGHLGDILETPGYCDHERVQIVFTPKFLIEALDKCPSAKLTFSYDASNPMKIIKIDDGAGYEAWVMTRRPNAPSQGE